MWFKVCECLRVCVGMGEMERSDPGVGSRRCSRNGGRN